MICIAKRDLKFKSGEVWEQGSRISVVVERNAPTVALVTRGSVTKRIGSINLWMYFEDFERFTQEDVQEAMMDGECNSLTGYQVEPDGFDPEGFPSVLLALGLC